MNPEDISEKLQTFFVNGDFEAIRAALEEEHPDDVVTYLEPCTTEERAQILKLLPIREQATIFGYFESDEQIEIAELLTRRELSTIITNMSHDERADLFVKLSKEQQESLLPGLAQAERDDILRLASYPDDQAGSVMTSDYATLSPEMTKEEAIQHLSRIAPDRETIYQAFVVDNERRLIGVVSLKDLIVARARVRVDSIMREEPISISSTDARELAGQLIADYDLMALPVVDSQGKLLGIITYDDAIDVIEEETSIDFHKSGGVGGITQGLKEASVGLIYRKRVFWLVLLVFGNIFSGAGIAFFEDTIAAYIALVFFLPLLVDSGGNAGSQSATLMVRALATRDVGLQDWSKMLGREVFIAALLGITMAIAVSMIGLWRGGPEIALVVSLTMVSVVIVGSLVGMSIPFLLTRFNMDPATASAPLITSIADACGVMIYFTIATLLLQIPA